MKTLLINVAVCLALIALIEGGVRLVHPEIGPIGSDRSLLKEGAYGESTGLQPGAVGVAGGETFQVDERGLWAYAGADTSRPAWLFLGDSVTMGPGVDPDSTFAGRVAISQDSLDVWNPSIIGYSSADYFRVFAALLDKGRVRRATVFWCLNDIYAGVRVAAAPEGTRVLGSPFMAFVRKHVFTFQWLKATLYDRQKDYYLYDRPFYLKRDAHWAAAMGHFSQMAALARARGITFDVVLLPYEYQLRSGDMAPQRVMTAALGQLGITISDVAPALRKAGDPKVLYLYGDGIHLSARAHRVIGEILLASNAGQSQPKNRL